jgi:hypothetical protein
MNLMEKLQLIGQAATVISVIIAIWTIRENGNMNRRMMNMEVFTRYTERYEQIIKESEKVDSSFRLDPNNQKFAQEAKFEIFVISYLNLVSEEYYLKEKGYLDIEVWNIWESEIVRMLNTPLFVNQWQKRNSEFHAFPGFTNWVTAVQKKNLNLPEIDKKPAQ